MESHILWDCNMFWNLPRENKYGRCLHINQEKVPRPIFKHKFSCWRGTIYHVGKSSTQNFTHLSVQTHINKRKQKKIEKRCQTDNSFYFGKKIKKEKMEMERGQRGSILCKWHGLHDTGYG